MATRILARTIAPKTYPDLKRRVEVTLLTGQRMIDRAKVRTYWETGRLIEQHLLLNQERAAYGAQVIPRLARDLDVSDRVLYQCLQFARAYPILHDRAEFTWAHYRVLIQIADPEQRKAVEIQALKKDWTSPQLESRVRELSMLNAAPDDDGASAKAAPDTTVPNLLKPQRGTPGLYRIVTRGDRPGQTGVEGLAVDLGFKIYRPLEDAEARGLWDGAIVRLDGRGTVSREESAAKTGLFTYPANVCRVIDGDTIVVEIGLLPRCVVELKLRLRGLDCPEVDTPEGKAAKRFTAQLIATATGVIIYTTKPDKYDRYLADVFLRTESGEEIFLNNVLLEMGHAVRKDSWQFRDWEPDLLA